MTGSYDPWLVGASIATAMIVSYVAVALVSHVRLARGLAAAAWIAGGAGSLGIGVWAMHFLGMLAFSLPIPLVYDLPRTLGSILPAAFAAAAALLVARRPRMGVGEAVLGGAILAGGVGTMHFVGMSALQIAPPIVYDPVLVGAALAVGTVASSVALWLSFHGDAGQAFTAGRLGGAVVLGGAISAMHYLGMAAAGFSGNCVATSAGSGLDPKLLALMIGAAAFCVVGLTITALVIDFRLAERTTAMVEELRREKERAESASRAKSEFLANVSHELRTPLNAIIGFSDVIRTGTFGPLGNERYDGYVENIHKAGRHLLGLIDDILDVSAIEAGHLSLREEPMDVGSLVAAALAMVRPRAEQGGVALTCQVAPKLPFFLLDAQRFKQVLLNLLSNAVKFTPEGGTVGVDARVEDGTLVVAVSDTGIGMDRDGVAKALQPFGQVESILSRRREGVGLGLPLTKALVEAHAGRMTIDSALGRGTTVSVRLPARRLVPRQPQPA